jgi:hypothetical protein
MKKRIFQQRRTKLLPLTVHVNFVCFKEVGLIYSRVGAGAAEAASNFCPEPEPNKNDTAQQHCIIVVIDAQGDPCFNKKILY